jgi:hypothetical protein
LLHGLEGPIITQVEPTLDNLNLPNQRSECAPFVLVLFEFSIWFVSSTHTFIQSAIPKSYPTVAAHVENGIEINESTKQHR